EDAYHGQGVGRDSAEARVWYRIGRLLCQGRKHAQISKREAARRARISEALWRLLENGGRDVNGTWMLPNPRPENLLAATLAVGIEPEHVFSEIDITPPTHALRGIYDDRLAHKVGHLSDHDRYLVERLVDTMLQKQYEEREQDPFADLRDVAQWRRGRDLPPSDEQH
ncbi:MAG: hypothetical protein ACYDEN_07720, partial [Acidimicrobiales bacterium]